MLRMPFLALLSCTALLATGVAGFASDMPVKARGTVAQSNSVYVWVDGAYQSIKTPGYDLGARLVPAGAATGSAASFDPRVNGYGISGGVGFVLPQGMFLSNIGRNARIEFGGSYVNATASQTSAISAPGTATAIVPHLNGVTPISTGCGAGCAVSGDLSTSYTSWQASGKFLTDYQMNGVTLTPSLKLFGGKTRNNQTLSDTMTFSGSATVVRYNAETALNWTDWGGRVGLSASVPVTDRITFGLSGNAGVAARSVSFDGSDSSSVSVLPGINTSSISITQKTTTFVSNAETSLTFRLAPQWSLRTFVGIDYDSKIPGIVAPAAVVGGGTSTAASINYHAETSYYAGGGLTAKF